MAMLRATKVEGMVFDTGWMKDGIWTYFASFYGHAALWMGHGDEAAQVLYDFANHAVPTRVWREEQKPLGKGIEEVGDMPHNWASAEFIRLAVASAGTGPRRRTAPAGRHARPMAEGRHDDQAQRRADALRAADDDGTGGPAGQDRHAGSQAACGQLQGRRRPSARRHTASPAADKAGNANVRDGSRGSGE